MKGRDPDNLAREGSASQIELGLKRRKRQHFFSRFANLRYFYPFLFALSEHVHISCIPGVSYSIPTTAATGISHSTSYSISSSVGVAYRTFGISGLEFHAAFLSFLVFFRDPVQVLALEASTHA